MPRKVQLKTIIIGVLVMLASTSVGMQNASAATWLESFVGYNDVSGISNNDDSFTVKETSDGNYVVGSITNSVGQGHDAAGGNYFENFLLQKLNSEGKVLWSYSYGGAGKSNDYLHDFKETSDGGLIAVGGTDRAGSHDILVVRLDSDGVILWQKSIGGLSDDIGHSIIETYDGNFVVAGQAQDAAGFGGNDGVLIKLDSSGNLVWQHMYGGINSEILYAVVETSDHGYLGAGITTTLGEANGDAWAIKVGEDGKYDITINTWSLIVGGNDIDQFESVMATSDGNYLGVGFTRSPQPTPSKGFAVKMTPAGAILWQKVFAGGVGEFFADVTEDSANNYVLVGQTSSAGAGLTDGWLVKLNSSGGILLQKAIGDTDVQHIRSIDTTSDNGYLISGGITTPFTGKADIWVGKLDINGDTEDTDCITSTVTTVAAANAGFASSLTSKDEGATTFPVNNDAMTRVSVSAEYLETSSYCASYLEITGFAVMNQGTNNELTLTAYDTSGAIRTNYSGLKNLTFTGLADDGSRFPKVEGVNLGTVQPVNFTAGVSDALITTLTPQIAETATLSVTDGELDCDPVNSEPSHCLALRVDPYTVTWSELFETGGHDIGRSVKVAPDGNYIVGSASPSQLLLQKIDPNGVVIWETSYGDVGIDTFRNLEVLANGSIIVGANSNASGSDDFMAIKLDGNGAILWQNRFDLGLGADTLSAIHPTADGGYVMVGQTASLTLGDGWIIRLDSSGNAMWQNTYGGPDADHLSDIIENSDGSFIAVGWTWSFPAVHSGGEYTGWAIKTDSMGKLSWSNAYELNVTDPIRGAGTDASGLFNRITDSVGVNKKMIMGKNVVANAGSYSEALLMQIDEDGSIDWIRNYGDGNINEEELNDLVIAGGDYYVAGNTTGFGGGANDGLFMKIDFTGNNRSARAIGDALNNIFYSIDSTSDGGFVLAGRHQHPIPPPGLKQSDIWVVKTDGSGGILDPGCATSSDITASMVWAGVGNKVTDVTALTSAAASVSSGVAGSLVQGIPGLSKFSFCTANFTITGGASMIAGTDNELTISAYDYNGALANLYDGVKYLTFSGLSSIGTFNPNVETVDLGTPVAINFTAGTSDPLSSTLKAFKAETKTVHCTDGSVTSQPHDGLSDGGLNLTVDASGIDHYEVSGSSPQLANVGWKETVTALDAFGNVPPLNSPFIVSDVMNSKYYTDASYDSFTSGYRLSNGVANIYIMDQLAEMLPGIPVSDSVGKSGLSGVIIVNGVSSGGGGGSSGGNSGNGGGGNSLAPFEEDTDSSLSTGTADETLRSAAEEGDFSSLSCLKAKALDYDFNDISGHYAANAIKLIGTTVNSDTHIAIGYIGSDSTHLFKPDQFVSRAEFLKMSMLSNCLSLKTFSSASKMEKIYRDIPINSKAWYKDIVYSATEKGIISGFEDGNFHPDDPITQVEAIKILVNIQHLIGSNYVPKDYFVDVKNTDWFFKYVSVAKENGLITGIGNGFGEDIIRPYETLTRADTVLMLVEVFKLRDYVTLDETS